MSPRVHVEFHKGHWYTHTARDSGKVHAGFGLDTETMCDLTIDSKRFDPQLTGAPRDAAVLLAHVTCTNCVRAVLKQLDRD